MQNLWYLCMLLGELAVKVWEWRQTAHGGNWSPGRRGGDPQGGKRRKGEIQSLRKYQQLRRRITRYQGWTQSLWAQFCWQICLSLDCPQDLSCQAPLKGSGPLCPGDGKGVDSHGVCLNHPLLSLGPWPSSSTDQCDVRPGMT